MATAAMQPHTNGGGHLYTQTNETENWVIHYLRAPDGTITESERVPTGGARSAGYNPIVNRESTPNPFEGVRSVILSPDNRLLAGIARLLVVTEATVEKHVHNTGCGDF